MDARASHRIILIDASLQQKQQAEGVQRTIRKCVYILLKRTIICVFEWYAPMHFSHSLTIVSPFKHKTTAVSRARVIYSLSLFFLILFVGRHIFWCEINENALCLPDNQTPKCARALHKNCSIFVIRDGNFWSVYRKPF